MRDLLAFQADLRHEARGRLAPIQDMLTVIEGDVEFTLVIDDQEFGGPSRTPW